MKKRVYTEEFRREAVRLLRTSGKSARQVADELGMPQSVLSRWKCTADNAQKTPAETLSMEEEVRQLRREKERLRMEREVLKKATAFFAKESTSGIGLSRRRRPCIR